ncbi:MAG TPA: MerR family transcriptional regulator [Mycobacteriales bacterium]|nr:MerR family transcriptional regulator [Mycobacteriales bacterium]
MTATPLHTATLNDSSTVGDIGTCGIGEEVAALQIVQPLTVSEAAERLGLSVHTLRWYERIGLLDQVGRDTAGHRRYTSDDIEWLLLLIRLRATGMPVKDMIEYAELVRAGRHTGPQRRQLLEAHRTRVAEHIAALTRDLRTIDYKINAYRANERAAG